MAKQYYNNRGPLSALLNQETAATTLFQGNLFEAGLYFSTGMILKRYAESGPMTLLGSALQMMSVASLWMMMKKRSRPAENGKGA